MSRSNRAGFTLVELLVVISILAVLATLTAVYVLPLFQDNKNVQRGLDRVTTMLLIAKQRALRDQRPVGVRFDLTTDDPELPGKTICTRMRYVEQPEFITGTDLVVTNDSEDVQINGLDLLGSAAVGAKDEYVVQDGDWIRLNPPPPGISHNLEIRYVGPDATALNAAGVVTPLAANSIRLRYKAQVTGSTSVRVPQFSVIRQTRVISGEDVVEMPQNVVINLSQVYDFSRAGPPVTYPYQVNMPPKRGVGTTEPYEIVFSPNSGVYNRATATPIVLWVHDKTKPATEPATALVIGIYPRTGMVGQHVVNTDDATQPLLYALDGKASGL